VECLCFHCRPSPPVRDFGFSRSAGSSRSSFPPGRCWSGVSRSHRSRSRSALPTSVSQTGARQEIPRVFLPALVRRARDLSLLQIRLSCCFLPPWFGSTEGVVSRWSGPSPRRLGSFSVPVCCPAIKAFDFVRESVSFLSHWFKGSSFSSLYYLP
jgi:hypothetical protein